MVTFRAVSASRRGGSFAHENLFLGLLESSTNLKGCLGIYIYIMPFSHTYTYIDSHYSCKVRHCQPYLQITYQQVIHTLSALPSRSPRPLSIGYGRWGAFALMHRSTVVILPSEGGAGESRPSFSFIHRYSIVNQLYMFHVEQFSINIFFLCATT